jgi:hypothetical protein
MSDLEVGVSCPYQCSGLPARDHNYELCTQPDNDIINIFDRIERRLFRRYPLFRWVLHSPNYPGMGANLVASEADCLHKYPNTVALNLYCHDARKILQYHHFSLNCTMRTTFPTDIQNIICDYAVEDVLFSFLTLCDGFEGEDDEWKNIRTHRRYTTDSPITGVRKLICNEIYKGYVHIKN